MSLFQNNILDNQWVLSNNDNVVVLYDRNNPYTVREVYAPFDGVWENRALRAGLAGKEPVYELHWVIMPFEGKSEIRGNLSAKTTIGLTKPITVGNKTVQGVKVWLEKDGEKVDIIPYLLQRDDTMVNNSFSQESEEAEVEETIVEETVPKPKKRTKRTTTKTK